MSSKSKKISANKNAKNKKKNNETVISGNELKKLLQIILIICAVLVAFYFITELVQNKDNETNESDAVAIIQYKKILVGEILNRKEQEYYVLVEKTGDSYIDLYKQYLDSKNDITYYTVDLSEIFNQNSIAEETFVEGNSVESYKFADTTLVKIVNGTLNGVYKNKNEITDHLKSL